MSASEMERLGAELEKVLAREAEGVALFDTLLAEERAESASLRERLRWFEAAHLLLANEHAFIGQPDGSVFFGLAGWKDGVPTLGLNMNDVFAWGCADAESFQYIDAPALLEIVKRDGAVGLVKWARDQRAKNREDWIDEQHLLKYTPNLPLLDRLAAAEARANTAEAAKSQALEALRRLLVAVTGNPGAVETADAVNAARAALSGSSAPQAPNSEFDDLLDEIGAGLGCTPYLDGGAINRAEAALSKLRAALSMKSEGSDPDSSGADATSPSVANAPLDHHHAAHAKAPDGEVNWARCPLCGFREADRMGRCVGHLGPPANTGDLHPKGETCSFWRASSQKGSGR